MLELIVCIYEVSKDISIIQDYSSHIRFVGGEMWRTGCLCPGHGDIFHSLEYKTADHSTGIEQILREGDWITVGDHYLISKQNTA